MTSKPNDTALLSKGKMSIQFRRANFILFVLAFVIVLAAMLLVFSSITRQISSDFAQRYAVSSANVLSSHIEKELRLLAKAANSDAVSQWFADEYDLVKKHAAFEEMSGVIRELFSNNLYVGVQSSLNEYEVTENFSIDSLRPVISLDRSNPDDIWFFSCIESDKAYTLDVGIDHILNRKRLWLDYKVVLDGESLGVICTGLDFTQVVRQLFAHSEVTSLRGLVVDENGMILMDSSLLTDQGFLDQEFLFPLEDEFRGTPLLTAFTAFRQDADSGAPAAQNTIVLGPRLGLGGHSFVTITPIQLSDWSAVIIYDSSTLFSLSRFFPAFTAILLLLVAVAVSTNAISNRLIFRPLAKLIASLVRLREDNEEDIYGLDRDDEYGSLSNTILDLFTKANHDPMTGLYNRRFMETNLQRLMLLQSRSHGYLSVLMTDVDFFKRYNDTYGHQEGDNCLKLIAKALCSCVSRTSDFAARYGGEEFILVLPNTDENGAQLLANKVLDAVRALRIPHEKSDAAEYVTISVGVASGRVSRTHSWTDYVKLADEALYSSKQNGRNRSTFVPFPLVEEDDRKTAFLL